MTKARAWAALLLLCLSLPLAADEAPDLELLEFLGEWQDDNGDWVDPQELEQSAGNSSEDDTSGENDDE